MNSVTTSKQLKRNFFGLFIFIAAALSAAYAGAFLDQDATISAQNFWVLIAPFAWMCFVTRSCYRMYARGREQRQLSQKT